MKAQLTRIVELLCDLIVSLWNLLASAAGKILNACRWKKLPVFGKIIYVMLLMAAAGFVTALCWSYYKTNYGRVADSWYYGRNEKKLSENIETHCFNTGKNYGYTFRVYNGQTGKYTTPRLNWVADSPKRDTLTVFSRKGKRGFLNINDGSIVIKEQYDKAWVFSEGLAAVVKDGKIGFINARNEIVIPFQYDYSYRNGMTIDYLFQDGYCTMTDERGACGLIDKSGKWVIEPLYDCIWTSHNGGWRIVKNDGKVGLLNPQLQFAYPIEYYEIDFAADNAGILLSKDGRKWQTDFNGNITRPFVVDYTSWILIPECSQDDEPQKFSDYISYNVSGRVGVMRRDNGQIIIPAIYNSVNMLSETLFEVQLRYYGDWILIDVNGNIVNNQDK